MGKTKQNIVWTAIDTDMRSQSQSTTPVQIKLDS